MSNGQPEASTPQCKNILITGLTADEKKRIIELHNELRQKVARGEETRGNPGPQPKAKQMNTLKWDEELSQMAQKWADRCVFTHDETRIIKRFPVGQNIALFGTTRDPTNLTSAIDKMVTGWYDEVVNHPRTNVANFKAETALNSGHYTQLVWGKTEFVGGGGVKYKDGKFNRFILVCNYGPAGNVVGAPVYEEPG